MSALSRSHERIVAVIQARMGSTRFPGKVLRPVAGQPLLWHIVHRLEKSRLIEKIAIATSTNPRDDAIVEFAASRGIAVVRGPEDDVLARFHLAATQLNAGVIVRVCSDAPFIEGGYIDHLISAMTGQGCDYVLSDEGAPNAHQGIDVFSRRALDKLMRDARTDPVAREHVTGYFKLHPDFVRIARAETFPESGRASPRLSIDTPDDLSFVETVYERLHAKAGEASLGDLLLLLEREPHLNSINAHVRQKALSQTGAVALIRCDGGGAYGLGHVKRMVALARSLRDRQSCGVMFAVHGTEAALEPIRMAGFEAVMLPSCDAPLDAVAPSPDICILDCRDGPSRSALEQYTATVPVSAVIDDASERRLAVDFAYLPPVPQALALDWQGSRCQARIGWQWALLGLSACGAPRPRSPGQRLNLLVAMGGSDPFALTDRCAQALRPLDASVRVRFVIGPDFKNGPRVAQTIVSLRSDYETIEGAGDLTTEYASADLALASFGVTAYELAAAGVPALYLAISPDHALSASAFSEAGMGKLLGLARDVSDETLLDAVAKLAGDGARRRAMRAAGMMTIDGLAADRIAADVMQALVAHRSTPTQSTG